MLRRDLLSKQIEQMSKALAQVLADFLQLPSHMEPSEREASAKEQLKALLDVDVDALLPLKDAELLAYLKQHTIEPELMDQLAELLEQLGKTFQKQDPAKTKSHFLKALEILHLADQESLTYSSEREQFKARLQAYLRSDK